MNFHWRLLTPYIAGMPFALSVLNTRNLARNWPNLASFGAHLGKFPELIPRQQKPKCNADQRDHRGASNEFVECQATKDANHDARNY